MSDRPRHRTVDLSEIGAMRMDAAYWTPPAVRAFMDQGLTRGAAAVAVARERAARDAEDAVVRFLLDGLGVESLAELRDLVDLARASGGRPAMLTNSMRFESGLYLPKGTPLLVKPEPDGWAVAHFRPDPFELAHVFPLAPDAYVLLVRRST